MEFLELMTDILAQLPPECAGMVQAVNSVFPWILLAISLLVCFLGYKIHHIWAGFVFFLLGFLLGACVGVLLPQLDTRFVLLLALVLGVLGASLTHKLLKIQIFLLNAGLVYAVLPGILAHIMPQWASIILGLAAAIVVGAIAAKYKFIVTIVTTACLGAATAVPIIADLAGWVKIVPQLVLLGALLVLGLVIQFSMEWKAISKEKAERAQEEDV